VAQAEAESSIMKKGRGLGPLPGFPLSTIS
jgi:hypothetical protein